MTKQNTWFDAFFDAVTSSGEFKSVVKNDWWNDFEKAIKKMETAVDKAWALPKKLQETFDTTEAKKAWEYLTRQPKNKTDTKWEDKQELDIIYPKDEKSETFGFAWIAWMDILKDNLRENFIKPLKFKFLVEGLTSPQPSPLKERENETQNIIDDENDKKIKAYKKIHEAYEKFWVSIPTGMLFYWPPGTWKTFITKKLAEELWAWLIKKSVWEFGSSYIHATSKNIRDFFTSAKKASEKWPIILFLDEIDSLVSKRTNNVDANKAEEVSQFLQEFNAIEDAPNLIVIAATNRPDHLDSALLRSWRMDKKIYIWPPDDNAREQLFKIYIEKARRPHSKLNYKKLSQLTDGYVAADLEAICDEVARDASKDILELATQLEWKDFDYEKIAENLSSHKITMKLLTKAIEETRSSLEFVDMSVFEKWESL